MLLADGDETRRVSDPSSVIAAAAAAAAAPLFGRREAASTTNERTAAAAAAAAAAAGGGAMKGRSGPSLLPFVHSIHSAPKLHGRTGTGERERETGREGEATVL